MKLRKHRPESNFNIGRSRHLLNEAAAIDRIQSLLLSDYVVCIDRNNNNKLTNNATTDCRKPPEIILFHPEDGSVDSAVRLFQRATVIVGVHGAGLANMMFAYSAMFDKTYNKNDDQSDRSARNDRNASDACVLATTLIGMK